MAVSILSAIRQRDISLLVECTKQLSDEGGLDDSLAKLSRRQLDDFWDGVLSLCLSTLLDNNDDAETEKNLDQMCEVLHCITSLASATLKTVVQTGNDVKDRNVPQSLQEAAIILHGVLPTLATEKSHLKDEMSRFFEYWWLQEIAGREELMGNTVLYLLHKSTQDKSTQADVARVKAVQQVLTAIDLTSESSSVLVSLLLQCTFHPQFVTTSQGIKFLAFLFTLDDQLTEKLHQSIRNHLPNTPKSWHSKYGEIYFRAWQRISDDKRENLEHYCLQNLMFRAVHINRDGHGVMAKTYFRVLSFIHKQKNQRGVEAMLARLYEPILWRSLMVTNSDIRVNAATLMFDVFPLQNPALHNEQADAALQKQFDLMHSLLSDPVVEVRLTAVRGVGTVLNIYWELIPPQVIQCFVTTLVQDLAYDISSPAVREAVIRVMFQLCDNHLCIPMLKKVLPELRNFVHDTSEKVRIAMFDLLLKIKQLRPIKFWNVVPVEHILARLEVDSASIAKRIMKLILPSFVPLQQSPADQMERCITLIMENPGAARQFFLHLPPQLGLDETVKYITMLCKYVLQSARQLSGRNNGNGSHNSDSSGSDSVAEHGRSSNKAKKSPSRKLRKTDQKNDDTSPNVDDSSEDDGDDDEGESVKPVSGGAPEVNMAVFRGLMEAIYLMYTVILNKLNTEANKQMGESLAKKLSITVRELMMMSQDSGLDSALIALAGHLPSRALPLISQNLVNRIKQGGSQDSIDITSIVKSLVLWGKAESVIQMIEKAVNQALIEDKNEKLPSDSCDDGKVQRKKKGVAFAVEDTGIDLTLALDLLVKMITQVECRPMLLSKYRESLMSLIHALRPTLTRLRDFLADGSTAGSKVDTDLHIKLYTMYLRLSAFLCTSTSDKDGDHENDHSRVGAQRAVNSALALVGSCVITHLEMDAEGSRKNLVSAELVAVTVRVSRSLMMIGVCDASFLDQIMQLCMAVLQFHSSQHSSLMSNVFACVYQLTQIRGAEQSQIDKDNAGSQNTVDLACACLCHFLKSQAKHMVEEKTNNEVAEDKKLGDDDDDDDDKENQDKKGDSTKTKNSSQVVTTMNTALVEIISELTRPGRPTEVTEKTMSAILDYVRREMQLYSKQDQVGEGEKLPPLTSTLMTAVRKRVGSKRLFIKQLHDDLDSGEVSDIHEVHGMVAVLAVFREDSKDLVPPALCRSVSKALAAVPVNMDEDVFRDLKTQTESQLQKWISTDIGETVTS